MPPSLDFYFFIGSTYSYLSVARAAREAARAGVVLNWKPFSVRTLMREQNNSPFNGKPAKLQYMWRDIERRAQGFGIPFNGAPPYPIDPQERANHVATLASMEGWCESFVQAAYAAWFLKKLDPGSPEHLSAILQGLGRDSEACVERAESAEVVALYKERTDTARNLGLFGSPSYVLGQEVFWGDDRLEDALAWCATAPGVKPLAHDAAPQVGVGVIVMRDGCVLLGRRKGSHGAGSWALPGGHLEFGESVMDCAIRETREETGLVLTRLEPGPYTNDVMAREGKHYVTLFVQATSEAGEPATLEPEKCEGWAWFKWSELPENLFLPLENLVRQGFAPR